MLEISRSIPDSDAIEVHLEPPRNSLCAFLVEIISRSASQVIKMREEGLKAILVALILSVLIGSAAAVAAPSMLTRGGKRLAETAASQERAAFHTDSGGETWPLATNAKEKSSGRGGTQRPESVRAEEPPTTGAAPKSCRTSC